MATQVKFYSTTAASYSAITTKDAGGVYFVDGGELYKGSSRFGANKIYQVSDQDQLDDITDQISGDLAVGYGWTKAWNGSAWVQIENDVQVKAMISLMTSGLASGYGSSYITHIEQDANGNVKAYAQAFPSIPSIGTSTKSGASNGVAVSVTTTRGVVTAVNVTAPAYTATESTKSSTANGITASVTTSKGQVTGVSLTAANLTPTSVSAESGTFTNLTVTSTADFSVTNVSATNLTVGGSTVEQLADKQIAAIASETHTSTSNGIKVSVTTQSGSVKVVSVDATAFGNVMHFQGVYSSPYDLENPQSGDIIIIGSASSGSSYVNGQEWIFDDKAYDWELIGDQNTYATKAYVDASVSELDSSKAKTGTGYASGAYGISGIVELYSNSSPIMDIYVNPVSTSADITTTAVKVVTANAVADYVTGKIGALDSTVSNGSSGVNVKVVQSDGKLTSLTTTITKASLNATLGTTSVADKTVVTAIGATGADTALPTEKAVRNAIDAALVWLDANGSAIS